MRAALVLALVGGCLINAPVIRFGGGKSAKEAQREELSKATPPTLVVTDKWSGEVTTAKIRVWADVDYRAHNGRWRQTFDDQLAYANEVLVPMLGIRLEAEYREWDHHAPLGTGLAEILAALATHDRGDDVLSVIGVTSAFGFSASFDQLGIANLPGRHVVVRGYADGEERELFERVFRDLGAAEREFMYKMRRRHKTAAVLLHELGHNLGAPHDSEPDTIMSPSYSDHSASFSKPSRELMLATVDWRLNRVTPGLVAGEAHPTLVISIDEAGTSSVGGVSITADSLVELLRLSFEDDHETEVVVRPDPKAPDDAVTKVLGRARAAGLARVSIAPR